MICPWCHGTGGEVDVILDDGTGPWEGCGLCKETGKVSLWLWVVGHYYNIDNWFKYSESRSLKRHWFSKVLCFFGFHVYERWHWVKEHHCYVCHKIKPENKIR